MQCRPAGKLNCANMPLGQVADWATLSFLQTREPDNAIFARWFVVGDEGRFPQSMDAGSSLHEKSGRVSADRSGERILR